MSVVSNPGIKTLTLESSQRQHTLEIFKIDIQKVLLPFLRKMQEAFEFLENFIVVFSKFDELRDKQHFFESSEIDEVKRLNNPHPWILREYAQMNVFRHNFFPN